MESFLRKHSSRFFTQEEPLNVTTSFKLAKQFSIEPMLLYSFMFPSEPDVVTGRLRDMSTVPTEWTGEGLKFFVPRCNLALSDLSPLIVEMGKGQATKFNEHPGFELAIPLGGGKIKVEFEQGEQSGPVSGKKRQFAYYSSDKKHRLRNIGASSARVFVARFYGWPQHGDQRGARL